MLKLIPRFRTTVCIAKKYSTNTTVPFVDPNTSKVLEDIKNQFPPSYLPPRQVWLESLDTIDEKRVGILELHPEVFAANPRIDIIQQNVRWQSLYRYVSYAHTKSRFEVSGGGRKPWPQKGTEIVFCMGVLF